MSIIIQVNKQSTSIISNLWPEFCAYLLPIKWFVNCPVLRSCDAVSSVWAEALCHQHHPRYLNWGSSSLFSLDPNCECSQIRVSWSNLFRSFPINWHFYCSCSDTSSLDTNNNTDYNLNLDKGNDSDSITAHKVNIVVLTLNSFNSQQRIKFN